MPVRAWRFESSPGHSGILAGLGAAGIFCLGRLKRLIHAQLLGLLPFGYKSRVAFGMIFGKVVGAVWATRSDGQLVGLKPTKGSCRATTKHHLTDRNHTDTYCHGTVRTVLQHLRTRWRVAMTWNRKSHCTMPRPSRCGEVRHSYAMILRRAIGSVRATRQLDALERQWVLLVKLAAIWSEINPSPVVAFETVDAGSRDTVMYATSREACVPFGSKRIPIVATMVGIVERVDTGTASGSLA